MAIRYRRVGLRVERVREDVRAGAVAPTRAQVDEALVALQADMESTAATVRDLRGRIRSLVKDARHREALRRRLSLHARRQAPADLAGLEGTHVARARFLAGVSQRDLASVWGVSRSALAAAEHDQRPIPEGIGRWARQVLRVSGEWEEPEA